MAKRFTRRRVIVGMVAMLVIGAIGGSVAMRLVKKDEGPKGPAVVTLEFAPADLVRVESRALARWLPVSGAVQPVRQATVKAKVSGDVRQITVREGETVQAGQVLARIDTADLDAKLLERIGALESAKAQLALAEKTRTTNQTLLKQNFISQNAFDNSESSYNVALGSVKSAEAQVQIARNALRDAVAMSPLTGVVAKRHVQPGEKVAFDSPLVTVVDLKDMELQAAVPATDVPELSIGKIGRARHRRLRRPPLLGPRRADQSGDRARHALVPRVRRHSEQRQRIARRDVRDGPDRALGEHAGRDAPGNRHTPRRRPDIRLDRRGRQARQANRHRPGRVTTRPAASRSGRRCRRERRCWARNSTT